MTNWLLTALPFGLVLLIIAWKIARARRRRSLPSVRYRIALTQLVIVCGVVIIVICLVRILGKTARDPTTELSMVFLYSLIIILQGWQWYSLKDRAKAEAEAAIREKTARKQASFFWQGIFILLPVLLMSGFGFWALLREHSAVEQDARQRAKDILQGLPAEFGRMPASRLGSYDASKTGWFFYLTGGVSAWPNEQGANEFLDNPSEISVVSNDLATLKSALPDWTDGPPPIVDFAIGTNGNLLGLNPMPPVPPAWFSAMHAAQLEAWTALASAHGASGSDSDVVNLFDAFQQTQPPADALACAEFIRLRAELENETASNAVEQLMLFAGHHYKVESESGVPLRTLCLAEALKRARDCGPTARLWSGLSGEVMMPSPLTSRLLDDAARLVAGNTRLSEGIKAMRIILADREAQEELGDAIKESGRFGVTTTTNLWVDAMDRRWFCLLNPPFDQQGTITSNRPISTSYHYTQARCYPKSLVAFAFAEALREANVKLPGYFSISLLVEKEPVVLPRPWNNAGEGKAAGEIFAEEHLHMWQPAVFDTGHGTRLPFESMPSTPQFTIQVLLSDRSLLYARQRQFQLIFGSLIALAALAAFVGFAAARNAFRKQLRLSELKSDFVSSVSHELRAPIASVRLMAEGLERGKIQEPAKQHEYFKFIVQECRRLSSLIENVLDFSRIEEGRKRYEMESTDLVALTSQTVRVMETYAAERQVTISLRVEGEPAPVDADGKALQQALVNLIDNAIKHSPKGSNIAVALEFSRPRAGTVEAQAGQAAAVLLSVEDHGEGIAASEQEKIFERFYRVGSELRRETQGVGIGLSIVKHIVEAHGGRVTVRSAPGQGSRFTIELPVGANAHRPGGQA